MNPIAIHPSANAAWLHNLDTVMRFGDKVSPRGIETKECLSLQSAFDMKYPVCHNFKRKLSYKFMAAEAYWIVSGSMFAEDITPYNKFIGQFSDDGYIFNGNYGVPYAHQLEYIVNTLVNDIDSRQATMTIWRPNPINSKDYPCTISLIFNVRDGKINTDVTMRSQDLYLGQPYDFFNFTMMTLRILIEINKRLGSKIDLGTMYWKGVSTHIYEKNFAQVTEMLLSTEAYFPKQVSDMAKVDWLYLSQSLIACRDLNENKILNQNLWRIRPEI